MDRTSREIERTSEMDRNSREIERTSEMDRTSREIERTSEMDRTSGKWIVHHSLQLRPMRGVFSNANHVSLFLMIPHPRMSLQCKLVPV